MMLVDAIETLAKDFKLDVNLIAAICKVESNSCVWSVRYEQNWTYFESPADWARSLGITPDTETQLQKFSWGPMQVMGSVARQHGYRGYLPLLCDPYQGVLYGCKHLTWFMERHGYAGLDLISAYNCGTPEKDSKGNYLNDSYVKKVQTWVEFYRSHGVRN